MDARRERLTRLKELLGSREHMRELMRRGKAEYWNWRSYTQKEIADLEAELGQAPYTVDPDQLPALKFRDDFDALTSAFNLLETLGRDLEDLEPEEHALIADLKKYIRNRSEPVTR